MILMSTQDLLTPTQDALIEIRVLCCAAMNPEETTTHEDAVAAIAKVVDGMMKPASKKLRLKPLPHKINDSGYICPNSGHLYFVEPDGWKLKACLQYHKAVQTIGVFDTESEAWDCIENHRNDRLVKLLEEVNP